MIKPDGEEGKDTCANLSDPGMNLGEEDWMTTGHGPLNTCIAYLQFDLDSVPDNAVITDAELGLFYYYGVAEAEATIGIYNVEESWDEGSITWNDQPATAATPEYTCNVPGTPTVAYLYWTIGDLVKGWWDGSISNNGVMLKDTDESTPEGWIKVRASECENVTVRPQLIIYYYDPNP